MTIEQNLQPIVSGDDAEIPFTFTDSDGEPINIVGDTIILTFKSDKTFGDEDAEMQVLYTVPDTLKNRNGVLLLPVAGSATAIIAGTYFYDFVWLKTSSGAGKKETLYIGTVKILQGISSL